MSEGVASVSTIIDEALITHGPDLAKGKAVEKFNALVASSIQIKHNLRPDVLARAEKYCEVSLICSPTSINTSDHPSLVIARDCVRHVLSQQMKANQSPLRHLWCGATAREFKNHHKNTPHHFWMPMLESKDVTRVYLQLATLYGNKIRSHVSPIQNAAKRSLVVRPESLQELLNVLEPEEKRVHLGSDIPKVNASVLVYEDSLYNVSEDQLCEAFAKTGALEGYATIFLPNSFISDNVPESDIYTLSEDWGSLKLQDAISAVWPSVLAFSGAFIPLDMVEDWAGKLFTWLYNSGNSLLSDWVDGIMCSFNPLLTAIGNVFDVVKFGPFLTRVVGKLIELLKEKFCNINVVWKRGIQAGYRHNYGTWKKWAAKRRFVGSGVVVDSEITARFGEMYLIKFYRSDGKSELVHSLQLPEQFEGIRVLNFAKSWDRAAKRVSNNKVYDFHYKQDFYKALTWAMGEPVESLSTDLITAALIRIRNGVSLSSTVVVAPLRIQDQQLSNLALVVYLCALRAKGLTKEMVAEQDKILKYSSNLEELLKWLGKGVLVLATGGLVVPAYCIYRWLAETHPDLEFVEDFKEPPAVVERPVNGHSLAGAAPTIAFQPREDKLGTAVCQWCDMVHSGRLGKQKIESENCKAEYQKVSLTPGQVSELLFKVREAKAFHQSKQAMKIVEKIKPFEKWLETKLETGLEHDLSINIIRGPPGTGKSFLIREQMNFLEESGLSTACMLPFRKLLPDYEKQKLLNGKTRDFVAHTTWAILGESNVNALFVDESTAVHAPYVWAFSCYAKVSMLTVVGDEKQTMLAADEGIPLLQKTSNLPFNYSLASDHTLFYNMRSDSLFVIKLLNRIFGYRMGTFATNKVVPEFLTQAQYKELAVKPDMHMVFAHESAGPTFGLVSRQGTPDEDGMNLSVRSSQGSTCNVAACSASQLDAGIWTVHGMLCVALSRHRKQLYFVTPSDVTDPVISEIRRTLKLDSEEEIAKTWKMPLPTLKEVSVDLRMTEDDMRFENRLSSMLKSGMAYEEPARVFATEERVPEEPKFSIKQLTEEEQLEEEYEQFKQVYNCCLTDTIIDSDYFGVRLNALRTVVRFLRFLANKHEGLGYIRRVGDRYYRLVSKISSAPNDRENILYTTLAAWFDSVDLPYLIFVPGNSVPVLCSKFHKNSIKIYINKNHATVMTRKQLKTIPKVSVKDKAGDIKIMNLWDDLEGVPISKLVHWNSGVTDVLATVSLDAGYFNISQRLKKVDPVPAMKTPFTTLIASTWDSAPTAYVADSSQDSRFLSDLKPPGKIRPDRVGMDAYKNAELLDQTEGFQLARGHTALNLGATLRGPAKLSTSVRLQPNAFWEARTKSGKIKHETSSPAFRSFTPGLCNHYGTTPAETLQAAARPLARMKKPALSAEVKEYSEQLARRFVRDNFRKKLVKDPAVLEGIHRSARAAMAQRNYDGRTDSELKRLVPTFTSLFSNKPQRKFFKDGLDVTKAGQGITQPTSQINLEFCSPMRQVNAVYKASTRDHFFYDNLESTEAFRFKMTRALRNLPRAAMIGISDARWFDAQQGPTTVDLEQRINRLTETNMVMLGRYYKIRGRIPLTMFGYFRGKTNGAKGSGFLDTLKGNSQLSACQSYAIYRGFGPKVVASKGDDYLHAQVGLHEDLQAKAMIKAYYGMKYTLKASRSGGEFCGNSVTLTGMFRSITRVALKALAAPARDYKMFCEQQKAWRQAITDFYTDGYMETIQANMAAEKRSYETVRLAAGIINSISHLSKKQWLEATTVRSLARAYLPGAFGPLLPRF